MKDFVAERTLVLFFKIFIIFLTRDAVTRTTLLITT